MSKRNVFFVVSLLLIGFVYLIFNFEYRTPILIGFILSALTYPLYKSINTYVQKSKLNFISSSVTALATVIISGFIIYFSSSYIILEFIKEINVFSPDILDWVRGIFSSNEFKEAGSYIGLSNSETSNISQDLVQAIEPYLSSIINLDNLNRVFSFGTQFFVLIFNQLLYVVISIIAWYNGLVFGKTWIDSLIGIIPISNEQKSLIKKDLKAGIRNVIYANLLSGVLNGVVVFIIMNIFGIPGAFLGAIFAFLIGFLPLTPSELSFLPALIFLFYTNPIMGLVVAIIGELFVLFLNYIFLPKITLSGTHGNPLFIITSVLSGIAIFGVMGFIIGPTIMIFINTLSNITFRDLNSDQQKIEG